MLCKICGIYLLMWVSEICGSFKIYVNVLGFVFVKFIFKFVERKTIMNELRLFL